jgi:hypothetical protein
MRIIGIDPGETTGIVVAQPHEGEIVIADALHVTGKAAPGWLASILTNGGDLRTEVVIERFNISQRTLQGTRHGVMETLYAIGALRYVCDLCNVMPFFQTPAQAKNAYSDQTLKDLDMWKRVSGPHERDALRHVLLHARTRGFWKGTVPEPMSLFSEGTP